MIRRSLQLALRGLGRSSLRPTHSHLSIGLVGEKVQLLRAAYHPHSGSCFFASKKNKTEKGEGKQEKKAKVRKKKSETTEKKKKKKKVEEQEKQERVEGKKKEQDEGKKKKMLLYSSEEEDENPIIVPQISILDLQEQKTKARQKAIERRIEETQERRNKIPAYKKPKNADNSETQTLESLNSKVEICDQTGDLVVKIQEFVDVRIPKRHMSALFKLKQLLQKVGIEQLSAFCDGGWKSRKDVGAIGVCLVIHDAEMRQNYPLLSLGVKLHNTTNNQCEHLAILFALILFEKLGLKKCSVLSDSDLAICQVNGTMKIYNAALKKIVPVTHLLIQNFTEVDFTFIRREFNQLADALVKLQFDSTVPVHFTLSNSGIAYLEESL